MTYNKKKFQKYKIKTIIFSKNINELYNNLPNKNSVIFYGIHGRLRDKKNVRASKFNKDINRNIHFLLKAIEMKPQYIYSIIISKTDRLLKKINLPKNIDYLYVNNINYIHTKIKQFPMGRDYHYEEYYNKFNSKKKNILCLLNFTVRSGIRKDIYNSLKDKNFITQQIKKIDAKHFYKQLNQCKFVICPRGCGLESYRFYDTLYSGAIPIVLKEKNLYDKFKNLPILIF